MYIWTMIFVNYHFYIPIFTIMTGCFHLFPLLSWFTVSNIFPAFPRWGQWRLKTGRIFINITKNQMVKEIQCHRLKNDCINLKKKYSQEADIFLIASFMLVGRLIYCIIDCQRNGKRTRILKPSCARFHIGTQELQIYSPIYSLQPSYQMCNISLSQKRNQSWVSSTFMLVCDSDLNSIHFNHKISALSSILSCTLLCVYVYMHTDLLAISIISLLFYTLYSYSIQT